MIYMENPASGKLCLFSAGLLACVLWLAADTVLGIPALRHPGISVRVPDLLGRPFTDEAPGDAAYFQPSVTYMYDDETPPRTVLSQSPPPGAVRKIIPGGTPYPLTLVVSLGPREIRLPDTRGMDVRKAKNLLTEKGLSVEISPVRILDGAARHTPTHAVLDTCPAPDETVGDATRVTLFIAEPPGDDGSVCPDLIGLSVTEAVTRLQTAGFRVAGISATDAMGTPDTTDDTDPSLPGHAPVHPWLSDGASSGGVVTGQDKPGGCYLPRGTSVALTIRR